jgi:hypothetical protein
LTRLSLPSCPWYFWVVFNSQLNSSLIPRKTWKHFDFSFQFVSQQTWNSYRVPRCTVQRGLETVRSHENSCFIHLIATLRESNNVCACCFRAAQQPIRIHKLEFIIYPEHEFIIYPRFPGRDEYQCSTQLSVLYG